MLPMPDNNQPQHTGKPQPDGQQQPRNQRKRTTANTGVHSRTVNWAFSRQQLHTAGTRDRLCIDRQPPLSIHLRRQGAWHGGPYPPFTGVCPVYFASTLPEGEDFDFPAGPPGGGWCDLRGKSNILPEGGGLFRARRNSYPRTTKRPRPYER